MYEHLISYVVWLKNKADAALENENQEQMEQLAFFDSLTGLKNRGCFEKDCEKYLPVNLTVIFIDANELKVTNDTYGHQIGDELLKCISKGIQQVWSKEYAYRVGGDEFWIMLQNVDDDTVGEEIAEFKDALSNFEIEGMRISVAIGVAKGNSEKTIEELITEADQEMYKDKRQYKKTRVEEKVPTVGTFTHERRAPENKTDGTMLLSDIFWCGLELMVLLLIYRFIN